MSSRVREGSQRERANLQTMDMIVPQAHHNLATNQEHHTREETKGTTKEARKRDTTGDVLTLRPSPVIIGLAPPGDFRAEAYSRSIGSWGTVSADIGRRWEVIAAQRLAAMVVANSEQLGLPCAVELLLFDSNPGIHREIERAGISCPDAVLLRRSGRDALVAQAVDFKVSLDTADFEQVGIGRLQRLLAAGLPGVDRLLHEALQGIGEQTGTNSTSTITTVVDGVFVAPDSAFNRKHLQGRGNAARRRPLRTEDVILLAVEPTELTEGLSGWEQALWLMELDQVSIRGCEDLSLAEGYLRLGSGIANTFALLAMPLFDQCQQQSDRHRELLAMRLKHCRSSIDVIETMRPLRQQRQELFQRRDRLLRLPWSPRDVQEALGWTLANGERLPQERWDVVVSVLEYLRHRYRVLVLEQATRLLLNGFAEIAVLQQLEHQQQLLLRQLRAELMDQRQWLLKGIAPVSAATPASGVVQPDAAGA